MMSQLRVLIVGASVAGPSAAYWFAKAGANVTVIERFPKLRTSGQNIDIRTAGVSVMRKIPGMEAAVRAKIVPIEGFCIIRESGQPLLTIKPTGNPDQQSLVSEYEIYRGDLAQILVDLTKNNKDVKYIFDEQVASIQQNEKDNGPVKVEFANGTPASEYDLVVACDGATSRTRAMGLGCGVRDHLDPTNCWAAYFSFQQDLLDGSQLGLSLSAPGGRFMGLGPSPEGGGKGIFMSLHSRGNKDAALPFRQAMKQGEDALKEYMVEHYKGIGWKTEAILKGMMGSKDFYANEIVQVKVPSLSKGHFVLVGDAGYAPGFTGTGTTLALAGAYMLAGEISKHKGDLAAGLRGYEEQMRPMINEMQKMPPFITTILAPETAWGLSIRNTILAFIGWTGIINSAQRFLGSAFATTEEYKLPDYDWNL